MNIQAILEVVGATITVGGTLALMYVTIRSKLPQSTINLQNESINALERQNDLLRQSVTELTAIVTELKTRVAVLETIPIGEIKESLASIAASIDILKTIGLQNQTIMHSHQQQLDNPPNTTTVINNQPK